MSLAAPLSSKPSRRSDQHWWPTIILMLGMPQSVTSVAFFHLFLCNSAKNQTTAGESSLGYTLHTTMARRFPMKAHTCGVYGAYLNFKKLQFISLLMGWMNAQKIPQKSPPVRRSWASWRILLNHGSPNCFCALLHVQQKT